MAQHKPKPWHTRAWQMHQAGKSIKEIAATLGYSVNQVALVVSTRRDPLANLTTQEQWLFELTKAAVQGFCSAGLPMLQNMAVNNNTISQFATAAANEASQMVGNMILRARELAQQEAAKSLRVDPIADAEREIAQRHTGANMVDTTGPMPVRGGK